MCLVAFSYTETARRYEAVVYDGDFDLEVPDVVRTAYTLPVAPLPPPPPPVIEPVPDDEIVEDVKFEDTPLDEPLPPPPAGPRVPLAVPLPAESTPPPAAETKIEDIFRIVEDMPMFPGCQDRGLDKEAAKSCAEQKMLEYIYAHTKCPAIARDNGVEGKAIVGFVVEKDGSISNVQVLRGPAAGISEEAMRVVSTFPKWIPGKQRGKPVRVSFVLPVQFKLEK